MKTKIKIRDAAFIPFGGKSCSLYGDRAGEEPINFEWDNTDPEPGDICFFTDTYITRSNDYKCKTKIALPLESPPLRQKMYDYLVDHSKDFDVIVTFCQDYLGDNWIYRPHLGSMIRKEDKMLYQKPKFCSMVISDKAAIPNHAFRHIVANIAMDFRVDILGTGVGKPVRKLDALKEYAMSIVVEASSEHGCISEQLYDCFDTGTIPIYFGPKFTKRDLPICDDWVTRFWNTDDLRDILSAGYMQIVDRDYTTPAVWYSKVLSCVEDWLWEHEHGLFE